MNIDDLFNDADQWLTDSTDTLGVALVGCTTHDWDWLGVITTTQHSTLGLAQRHYDGLAALIIATELEVGT